MKKNLNNIKALLCRQESEIDSLSQDIKSEQQTLNKSKNNLLNKQVNSHLQNTAIKKAQVVAESITNSECKLHFMSELKIKSILIFNFFFNRHRPKST